MDCRLENARGVRIEATVFPQIASLELTIQSLALAAESRALQPSRRDYAIANGGGGVAAARMTILAHARSNSGHVDYQIDSIPKRS